MRARKTKRVEGGVLSTAAAPLSVRRRPAAARLVPTSTGCSRGAEACRFGHVTRAARCLLACERSPETPRCLPSMSAAVGVRAGPPGWAKLRAGLRARRPRRASIATSLPSMLSAFCTASPSSLGRSTGPERPGSGAMASLVVPRLPALRSGRRKRACAARRSTAGCSPPFQQHLLPRFSRYDRLRGPAPTSSLRQRCL